MTFFSLEDKIQQAGTEVEVLRGNESGDEGRLIIYGQDRPGIVAAVSAALTGEGANIVSLDQYSTDPVGGRFFQRTVFRMPDLAVVRPQLEAMLQKRIGADLGLQWRLVEASRSKRAAIFASKTDHCLLDLLWRQRRGELSMSVTMVVSNHPDLAEKVRQFDVPYFYVPVENGDKEAAEREHLRLLKGNVDLVILARYMQIISGDFIREAGVPIINIHHSFLPAFIGAGPYQKAKDRGVKLVGATAHYVTEDLDEGPIIEQDVARVTHVDTVRDLMRRGADVERMVLARAVGWHCEDRVLRDGNSTIVFAS
jgi:formyltetrahydrofolate deformylase